MKRFALILFSCLLLFSVTSNAAVDFQEELSRLAQENGRGYIGPFATAFGTTMNSGLYHTAKPHSMLGFDVSIKISALTVSDDDLTYDFEFPNMDVPIPSTTETITLNLNQFYADRSTSTVFGDDQPPVLQPDATLVDGALETALLNSGKTPTEIDLLKTSGAFAAMASQITNEIPPFTSVPGIGIDAFGLVMPQVSVGLPMGNEVLLRFFPEVEVGDFGNVSFLGLGLKHSVSQYIPLFPVNISAQFVWQKLTIGDLLESTHTAFNVQASKKLGIGISITPYVGMGMESSDLKVSYDIDMPGNPLDGQHVEFDLEGDNGFRMSGGVRLGLAVVTINADYSIGKYNVASLGIGLTLR